MIGKFIGIEGTSTMVTLWIEDLETHEVNQISSDLAVFLNRFPRCFPVGISGKKRLITKSARRGCSLNL